jgi:hypothetical protein
MTRRPPELAMPLPAESLRMLERCFFAEEWSWLQGEVQFKAALDGIRSLDQIESIINLGLRLISEARLGRSPSGRPPPGDASEPPS